MFTRGNSIQAPMEKIIVTSAFRRDDVENVSSVMWQKLSAMPLHTR